MKIQSIKIKNFKVFKDVEVSNLQEMSVFLGRNGTGKTTFFDVFGFLHDCLEGNVKSALAKRGGFDEVISREQEGNIEFEVKFRSEPSEPLVTYQLSIGLNEKKMPVVSREVLRFRRTNRGNLWKVLDFNDGKGFAFEGILNTFDDVKKAKKTRQKLESPDILAIKGLGQFREFETVSMFRRMLEDWFVADFKVDAARDRCDDYSESLTRKGANLAPVAKYIFDNQPDTFGKIIQKMKERVPGVDEIEAQTTQDGFVVLRFQSGNFKNPFSAKFVSDGTLKMFTYLVLLNSPEKHSVLCIEEPENQLYPELLAELAEEFRQYSQEGGQLFISTHSPDFLNAVRPEEIFYVKKENGFSTIKQAAKNELFMSCCKEGDLPGALWKQGILDR